MCSWCYGFTPQISQIKSNYPEIDFQLVMGGLRPFGRETMAEIGGVLRHHWEEVKARSGQKFGFGVLEHSDFVYDTEPPSRAVVTMRSLKPTMEFPFFIAVQEAFYRDNEDTNHLDTYLELARAYDVDEQDFFNAFNSQPIKEQTLQDFTFTQKLRVTGFPTTLLQLGQQYLLLAHGYAEARQVIIAMEKVFETKKN
jgi:putative protein-disulfide isomerase